MERERTRRLVWALIAVMACGCMICAPTPPPPPTPIGWEPQGSALWAAGTLTASVDTEIQTAGQGANHLEITVSIGAAGATTASDVRVAAFIRSGGTLVGSTNRLVTLASNGATATLQLVVCPTDLAVIDQPMTFELWAAREGDHQLLGRVDRSVTPTCSSGSCGTCR